MDLSDITLELDKLKDAFLNIADNDQKNILKQQATTLDDVKDAMRIVTNALKFEGGAGKAEKMVSSVATVFERIAPVIDPLTQLYPPVAPVIWGSIKVLLQVNTYNISIYHPKLTLANDP